ncbi:unnamed protein product [Vicia faba]|uniref:Uncharacterized protein n=1 Tax=Vicia faba TaxID=3906 RepID=A0AAV0ZRZ0_VICFA|nr:unnamed protein product [Vicia faba]
MRFLSSSAFVKEPMGYTLSTAAMDAIHQDSFAETTKLQYEKHCTLFSDSNHPHSFSEYSKMASNHCIRTVLNFEEIAKIGSQNSDAKTLTHDTGCDVDAVLKLLK